MKPMILIGGATGATGNAAVKYLLEKAFPVRALVHKEDERSLKLQDLGAAIVVGDYGDFRSMQRAFEGIQRAYFVHTIRPGIVSATTHFAEAALEAKAEFIVNMSQRTARPGTASESALQHWLAEQVFNWAGTPVCHLRPTIFNEWLLYMRKGIGQGHYDVPFGPTGRFAPISVDDQGAVIAAILADPSNHAGKVHTLLGPTEVTAPEIADIVSTVLGKEVRYSQVSGEQWVSDISGGKSVPFLAQHLDAITIDQADGHMAGTNDNVERISGRAPETIVQFLERNRTAFQFDR